MYAEEGRQCFPPGDRGKRRWAGGRLIFIMQLNKGIRKIIRVKRPCIWWKPFCSVASWKLWKIDINAASWLVDLVHGMLIYGKVVTSLTLWRSYLTKQTSQRSFRTYYTIFAILYIFLPQKQEIYLLIYLFSVFFFAKARKRKRESSMLFFPTFTHLYVTFLSPPLRNLKSELLLQKLQDNGDGQWAERGAFQSVFHRRLAERRAVGRRNSKARQAAVAFHLGVILYLALVPIHVNLQACVASVLIF